MRSYTLFWLNRLFNLLTAISGVLLVVVIAIWIRSYFGTDSVQYQPRIDYVLRAYAVTWGNGRMAVIAERSSQPAPVGVQWYSDPPQRIDQFSLARDDVFHLLGVRVTSRVGQATINTKVRELALFLPCWLAALLAGFLPAAWLMRWRAGRLVLRRLEEGCCVRCGYDLRASAGRCPECGTRAQPPSLDAASRRTTSSASS